MAPLRAELTPLHRGRGVRFLRRSREGGSQRESGGGKEKVVSPSFVDSDPKINLVEAHLNRPSLRAKGTIAPHRIRRSWNASRASLQNEGSGAARPRPPDVRGSRAGQEVRFTLCIGPPSSQRQGL
jgi:hypothetical protein